jgi:hypothetical protein
MLFDNTEFSLESLMDIVSEVPLLLERSKGLISSGGLDDEHVRSLLAVYKRMGAWKQPREPGSNNPHYWAVPSRLHNPSDDGYTNQLFPFALEYRCLNIAMLFMFGSAIMLQILSSILLLKRSDEATHEEIIEQTETPSGDKDRFFDTDLESGDTNELWPTSRVRREADKLARFLCQSIEYCCRHEMGTVGAQASCHSQFALRNYFRQTRQRRELDWCRNIKNIDGPGVRRAIEMMLFGDEEDTFDGFSRG